MLQVMLEQLLELLMLLDTTSPVFTSSSTFTVDENVTEVGTCYCN